MTSVIPTKGNLIQIKRSLALAKTGFDLMDKKRNILVREMMTFISTAEQLQTKIDDIFQDAYRAMQHANITTGYCESIAEAIEIDDGLSVRSRSVMGAQLPTVVYTPKDLALSYGFSETNTQFDEAFVKFQHIKQFICQLAEVENSVYRLAIAIKKTKKRANALKNIIIPNFQAQVKFITDALEEKEREEFVRLKVVKLQKSQVSQ